MTQNIKEEISKLIDIISHVVSANKIILFGSYAYGDPDENSDIDLCVVINNNNIRKRDLIRIIRKSIASIATMPVDILVYDKNEFYERASLNTTLEHKIAYEGVCVYEQ